MGVLSLAKDFHNLMKNISSFSNGQASVTFYEDDLKLIKICIRPADGLYRDGEFTFSIRPNLKVANDVPDVRCLTRIYHPNIDSLEDDGDMCLNLFEEWQSQFGLEDVVQGFLFLLYNPNLDDPLCPIFSPDMSWDEYVTNVKRSLDGEEVEGYQFPKNKLKQPGVDMKNSNEISCKQTTVLKVDDCHGNKTKSLEDDEDKVVVSKTEQR